MTDPHTRITEAEIKALLAIVMSYDNRRPGVANVTAWEEQGVRCRWTFDEAREAIHHHFATSTEFLMPAHITAIIKAARQAADRHVPVAEIGAAPPAQPERINAIVSMLARRLGWQRGSGDAHDPELDVECTHCHAAPGVRCSRFVSRGPHRGERQQLKTFHHSRVETARKANEA